MELTDEYRKTSVEKRHIIHSTCIIPAQKKQWSFWTQMNNLYTSVFTEELFDRILY